MKAFTYIKQGEFGFTEKEKPTMIDAHDAIVYDTPQILPLPDMYGKNLIFKTGGVDGCDCEEILDLIAQGKIDTTPLITHRFPLSRIEEAYDVFENRKDGVIRVAIFPGYTREMVS